LVLYLKVDRGYAKAITFNSPLWGLILLFSVLVVLFANNNGLYHQIWRQRFDVEISCLGKSLASASSVLAATIYLETVRVGSIFTAGMTVILSCLVLVAWRRFLHTQAIPGLTDKRNVLIVGGGETALCLKANFDQNPEFGYVVKGLIDRRRPNRPEWTEACSREAGFLGWVAELPRIIREHFIDEIFICVPIERELVLEIASYTINFSINLHIIPDLYDGLAKSNPVEYVGEFPAMALQRTSIPTLGLIFKRLIDIVVSASLLILLLPILLVVALLIKLGSRGPIFHASFRVGRKGETFRCHKFRSMVANAEAVKDSLRHLNERDEVTFKIAEDPRITPLGRFLRKYSLDELPQLWDVLMGDLSLVGPRPHPLDDYSRYSLEHRRRLEAKPGITGLWQVTARRDSPFEKNVALDSEYIENWSLWLDCQILWKTVAVVFAGTGQ
jgi:exopolysaccharide biosynthesis polyprenyl glycosylphosphotransferase